MGAISALSLLNGEATPVAKTFAVQTSQEGNNPAMWRDRSNGTYSSDKVITQAVVHKPNSTVTRVTQRLRIPEIDNDGNVTSITTANIEFVLPDNASLDARKDVLAFAKSLLAEDLTADAVLSMQPAY